MFQQLSLMRSWYNHKTAVLPVNGLHGCPRAYDLVSRAEWEIVQVLVHRMAGGLGAWKERTRFLTKLETSCKMTTSI